MRGENDTVVCDFTLPVCESPLVEHWPRKTEWADTLRTLAPFRRYYMEHSAEQRLRDKNPTRCAPP